jgi:predicted acetyltransferase
MPTRPTRIIESCDGILKNIEPHPDFTETLMRRYWIELSAKSS